ncbi:uncharacterized protein EAE97_004942 [Botrytis byssoidea]|uniref:J domain-containing protein n=1 Tax=Botrytis byssoidea TaxID=139641 RepID=A0A9P5LVN6_9HELO|nr:uncharacterized protein EAE97_004942 [Botrytis byssoidea]KAF7945904.1 hypothetical protein EAE97_004942 [Botrytis byssoidea]
MAAHRRQRSHLPSPPVSPSQQTPRPLPLPAEMTRYKTWQTARSRSMNIAGVPVPPLARRSVTAPVIGTTSEKFIYCDRSSSPESELVPKPVVKPEAPSRYTTSYYHILGLPESPDVTTEEIEEAFQRLVSNPSSHPSHNYENLEQIRKTLTSSIRRRTYDHGRRAHLLHQSQLKDRERFEKKRHNCDDLPKAPRITAQEIKSFTDDMRMKSLESELKMVKKEVTATFKRKVKNMGLSLSLDGLDEEEGVPWEEMDFGTRSSQIVGERMGLEFEFNGSGSEDDSGDEDGSEGTFSDGEEEREERKEPGRSEESEEIKKLEEFEELSLSAMTGLFSKVSSCELEKAVTAQKMAPKDDQETLDVKEERLSASEKVVPAPQADSPNITTASPPAEITSKSENETSEVKDADERIPDIPKTTSEIISISESNREFVGTKIAAREMPEIPKPIITTSTLLIDTNLPNILNIVELLYPTPPPSPEAKPKKKKQKNACKEIWEFDYNTESECDYPSDGDSESESDTKPSSSKKLQIFPSSSLSLLPPPSQIHELPGSEIWEHDYPNPNPDPHASSEQEKEEEHETIILFLQFLIVFALATAALAGMDMATKIDG